GGGLFHLGNNVHRLGWLLRDGVKEIARSAQGGNGLFERLDRHARLPLGDLLSLGLNDLVEDGTHGTSGGCAYNARPGTLGRQQPMSIVAPHCLAAPANSGIAPAIVLLVLTLFSIGTAIGARVFPPRKANGPLRIPPDRPAWPLVVVLFGAMSVYVVTGSLIFSLTRGSAAATQPATLPASPSLAVTALV